MYRRPFKLSVGTASVLLLFCCCLLVAVVLLGVAFIPLCRGARRFGTSSTPFGPSTPSTST